MLQVLQPIRSTCMLYDLHACTATHAPLPALNVECCISLLPQVILNSVSGMQLWSRRHALLACNSARSRLVFDQKDLMEEANHEMNHPQAAQSTRELIERL